VLEPEGILFAKIADYVHGHRFQWAHVDFIRAAVAVGFTACDCIVKSDRGRSRTQGGKRPTMHDDTIAIGWFSESRPSASSAQVMPIV